MQNMGEGVVHMYKTILFHFVITTTQQGAESVTKVTQEDSTAG